MKAMLYCPILLFFHLLFLPLAHGEHFKGEPGFPYLRNHYKGRPYTPGKTCREYLAICERSCRERGDMIKFACIEKNFQVWENKRFNCLCYDDSGTVRK